MGNRNRGRTGKGHIREMQRNQTSDIERTQNAHNNATRWEMKLRDTYRRKTKMSEAYIRNKEEGGTSDSALEAAMGYVARNDTNRRKWHINAKRG